MRVAEALIVAKLDRLSRLLADFASLLERAAKGGWALIALDLGVDTTTATGAAMAGVGAVFAELERRLIGERTRAALAAKKEQGSKLGRPRRLPAEVAERIRIERGAGRSFSEIARELDAEGVPTAQGGRWWAATVRTIVLQDAA